MESSKPLISIIVRTKNRPKLVKRALISISNQTYRPVEIVLVNDGGCDLSIEEIRNLLKDVSLHYIKLDKSIGRANAANTGIKNANGKYVGFLDDDDELYPDHLETLVTFLEQSDYQGAYTATEIAYQDYSPENGKMVDREKTVLSQDFSYADLLVGNYIPFNSLLLRRDILPSVGGIDDSFELYEDWDFLIRLTEKHPLFHIKKVTARYSQWSRDLQINQAESANMFSMHVKVLERHRDKLTPEIILSMKHEKQRLQSELKTATQTSGEYEKKIAENQQLIYTLRTELSETISGLQGELSKKSQTISGLQGEVSEKDKIISEHRKNITELDLRIKELERSIHILTNTAGWKLLEKFRRIRGKMKFLGRALELLTKSYSVLTNEGFSVFLRKARRKLKIGGQSRLSGIVQRTGMRERLARTHVDIIVPIHNGFDFLRDCVESVLKYTDLSYHSLVLVDDKSTDVRIREYVEKLNGNKKNVKVHFKDKNSGFVRTVNEEMKRSNADVVLLNSDTVVTENWVEKLQRAAYSGPNIATATPFSNNAVHCSIPQFLCENPVPDGYDVDSFARFVEKISMRYYPEIPTAVGFCMYIKRDVLEKAGFFDDSNFDKGYGEECEFSARTKKMGYIHVLDDSTYIYHKGSVSFTPDKRLEIVDKHLWIIESMYPGFLAEVSNYYSENPLKILHEYIKYRMQTA